VVAVLIVRLARISLFHSFEISVALEAVTNLLRRFLSHLPGLSITALGSASRAATYYWTGYHRLVGIPSPGLLRAGL
jgi:hypothetical protein